MGGETAVMEPVRAQSASQLVLLHRISNIVSSALPLEGMLRELIAMIAQVTVCDACLVYLADHANGDVVLVASQLPHAAEIGNLRLKMGEGVTGWVAAHRSVVALARNASQDARFKTFPALQEDTYEAFLSVPLVSGGDLLGVINVHHRNPRTHRPEEIALVTFIGEQMGGAIGKSRLAEKSQGALRRMENLAAVARTISGESYLDRILQAVSEMIAETFDSPVCSILVVDEEKRELMVSAARCSSPDYLHKMPIRIEGSLTESVLHEKRPIMVPNLAAEKQFRCPELARRSGIASLLSVPMFARDEVIGTINIYTREPRTFTPDEVGFVQVAAGQAANAIENARLMSETLEMKRALETRKLVERAKGILQQRHKLTEEEAYLRLRNESRRMRRPMRELAEALILAEDLNRGERAEAGGTGLRPAESL